MNYQKQYFITKVNGMAQKKKSVLLLSVLFILRLHIYIAIYNRVLFINYA